uniref:Uncharacterized protein n=1 Tax=Solanum tuberosum TaxID=4113 RepID=M1DAT5_SOLTU
MCLHALFIGNPSRTASRSVMRTTARLVSVVFTWPNQSVTPRGLLTRNPSRETSRFVMRTTARLGLRGLHLEFGHQHQHSRLTASSPRAIWRPIILTTTHNRLRGLPSFH